MKKNFVAILLIILTLMSTALADIEVHFLNVGEGDATLILCDGASMLVDGGKPDQSQFIFSYLKAKTKRLDYVVATHPDSDHIGGLSAAMNACTVGTVLSSVTESDTDEFLSFTKYVAKQGLSFTVPSAGDAFDLGGATVTIISCGGQKTDNNNSIVLRIQYGEVSFLLAADIETPTEKAIIRSGIEIESTVLRVAHHGSKSSSGLSFLAKVKPKYAIISVGQNSYGHPSDTVLNRLLKVGTTVFRTDLNGTIICRSNGRAVSFETETTAAAPTKAPAVEAAFIGNRNSKVFHNLDCTSVDKMSDSNRVLFTDRQEAIDAGYHPCKNCNP